MTGKPKLKLAIDWSLQQGEGVAYDEDGKLIAELKVPQERPPAETRLLRLSVEDYMAALRASGALT